MQCRNILSEEIFNPHPAVLLSKACQDRRKGEKSAHWPITLSTPPLFSHSLCAVYGESPLELSPHQKDKNKTKKTLGILRLLYGFK